jgi:single-stranded-DNA-specific exonuclease
MNSHNAIQGKKYLWQVPAVDTERVHAFASSYSLSIPIAHALVARGFVDTLQAEQFLFTPADSLIGDLSLLKDASKAVERIIKALEAGERILIAGDYDVDGITSSSLMMVSLLHLGANVNFFLPHRVHDGYGLSVKTVQKAAKSGYSVIITVDNGITAFAAAQEAKKLGIDLIITDHHRPHAELPDAFAIIDPHQDGCEYPYKYFAGVGIGFKLMSLLYERLGKPLPPEVYDLLLLGTVADVVPLTGENRYWVRYGLTRLHEQESLPIKVLKANSRVTKQHITSSDIGFFLTPQINALGRLDDAREGVKFLIGSDPLETERIGQILKELNEARKMIEKSVLASVETEIKNGAINVEQDRVIVASSTEWQPGVIGLVASRLVGAYGVPALLFHITKDGKAKGSCRSIAAFNMFEALHDMKELLDTFGGHKVAAGLSLPADRLPEFKKRLSAMIRERLTDDDFKQKITIDAPLLLSDVTKKFMHDVALLEPFGCENPVPTFYIPYATLIEKPVLLKDAHVKCRIFADGVIKPIIFFNKPELFDFLQDLEQAYSFAVQVVENQWQGASTYEFHGIDVTKVI